MRRALQALALVLSLVAGRADAQQMRTVDGHAYIVHTVEAGQTLFGISRHYAVPLSALEAANPGAEQGLSVGQVLLVPVDAQVRKELKRAPALADGELLHTVAKRETLYGIARQYGVTQEALLAHNPEAAAGLSPGMVLRVPVAGSTAAPPDAVKPAVADGSQAHEVMAGETVYGLARKYGISEQALRDANGGLAEGLQVGRSIKVPAAVQVDSTMLKAPVTNVQPRTWKVAVLLPFSTDAKDSTATAGNVLPSTTRAAVEFNAGLAMAVDTLEAQGLLADVHVFDTGDTPASWDPLLRSDSVRGMDLFIGPFHRAAVESLLRVSDDAPVICPVPQSNKVLLGHPTVTKVVGSRADQVLELARYVAQHHAQDNVLLCTGDIFAERDLQRQVKDQLAHEMATARGPAGDSVPVVRCPRRDVAQVIALLKPGRRNAVVVASEDVEFVTTVLNKLAPLVGKFDIVLFGMERWREIPTLDLAAMSKLDTHVPASDFIDYGAAAVVDFVQRYRERYRNEPGEYAFLGYDTGLWFLSALQLYGPGFPVHYAQMRTQPLHMDFNFVKMGVENGWRNEGAMMLEYRDMEVRRAQ